MQAGTFIAQFCMSVALFTARVLSEQLNKSAVLVGDTTLHALVIFAGGLAMHDST
jgi:hypothetical protein